jgi:TonB family protein
MAKDKEVCVKSFIDWTVGYVLNSLWMILSLFCVAWLAARAMRRMSPRAEHRVWVGALALEVMLPAWQVQMSKFWAEIRALLSGSAVFKFGTTGLKISAGAAQTSTGWVFSHRFEMEVLTVYGCVVVYFAARLMWGLWRTRGVVRRAVPVTNDETLARWQRHLRVAGVQHAQILESSEVSGPATVGIQYAASIVPKNFSADVEGQEMDAWMAHECAHIRRRDFAKNLLYGALILPASYHPAMWATWSRMSSSREMVCDELAAAVIAGRERYARALLRLAALMIERAPAKPIHAIGIFDANSLEKRIMQLTRKSEIVGRAARAAMVAGCVTMGVATCASAMALRMNVSAGSTTTENAEKDGAKVVMPVLISSVMPEYPKVSSSERINGTCIVSLTVDRRGAPMKVHIIKGLRREYDEQAVKAVRQYRFQPATRDGEPVVKDLKVEVSFESF